LLCYNLLIYYLLIYNLLIYNLLIYYLLFIIYYLLFIIFLYHGRLIIAPTWFGKKDFIFGIGCYLNGILEFYQTLLLTKQ